MGWYEDNAERLKTEAEYYEKLPQSQIGAALKSGGYGWLAGMGDIATALGAPTEDWTRRMAEEQGFFQQHAPGATSFEQLMTPEGKLSDYLTWLAGSSAPYMAEFALGAGAGSLATKGARAAARASMDLPAIQAARQATSRAALGGGVAASYPSAVGDILGNQREAAGEYDLGSALAGGVPYAALNAVGGEAAILKAILGSEVRNAGLKNLAKHVAVGALTTGLKEGASETGQEVINQTFGRMAVDPNATLTSGDALNRYFESFVGGAFLGGAMGGGAKVFSKTMEPTPEAIAARAAATDESKLDRAIQTTQEGVAGAQYDESLKAQQKVAEDYDKQWSDFADELAKMQKQKPAETEAAPAPEAPVQDPTMAFMTGVLESLRDTGLKGKTLTNAANHAATFVSLSPEQQWQFLQDLEDPTKAKNARETLVNDTAATAILNTLPRHPTFSGPINELLTIQGEMAAQRRQKEQAQRDEAALATAVAAKDAEVARRELARREAEAQLERDRLAAEIGPPDLGTTLPAAPNELDAAAMGIRERREAAPVVTEAAPVVAKPTPPAPAFSLYQGSKVPGKVEAERKAEERRQAFRERYDTYIRMKSVGMVDEANRLNDETLDLFTPAELTKFSDEIKTEFADRIQLGQQGYFDFATKKRQPAKGKPVAQLKEKKNADVTPATPDQTVQQAVTEEIADADERQDATEEKDALLTQETAIQQEAAPVTEEVPAAKGVVEESPSEEADRDNPIWEDVGYNAQVWDEEKGKFVREPMTAREAMDSVEEDISALKQFLACLKG